MLDEAIYISNTSKQLEFDNLINDQTLKRAIVRSVEIIGEAGKKISSEFKNKYPSVTHLSSAINRLILDRKFAIYL